MIGNPFRRRGPRSLGNLARDRGNWAEAASHFERHLADQPDDFAIWVQLGHMHTELSNFAAGDRAYARAGALNAADSDLLLCWARSRQRAGDIEHAASLYARSVAQDGNLHAANELALLRATTAEPVESAPELPAAGPRPAWAARIETVKPFRIAAGREVALFITHSATGALKPHVLPYLRALAAANVQILLLAVTDRELNITDEVIDLVDGAIVRENAGYDFAAWAHALYLHPEIYGAATLYLVNDSLIGPADQTRFDAMLDRIRGSAADLIGLTESHEYRWHIQTFFLALKPRLLASFWLQSFFGQVQILTDKDAVIRSYEVAFTGAAEAMGYRVQILFPSPLAMNPTLFDWRRLIADGLPFVKALLLRGAFPEADLSDWRATLADAGFDMALIDATLEASAQDVPRENVGRLFARPVRFDPAQGRPLRVAFYGPWNYDNGLGFAARAAIAALQRSGARVNLHPIKLPFHIHRLSAPAVDIIDFNGDADIAIVHLNPDSWFLLTPEQRDAVHRARRRIGYWVWEMSHISRDWQADFGSVDRIWAPSQYCADIFAAAAEAPVDVIPHAVPLPAETKIDREAGLKALDLPADRRIILYIFDGSSYLVRKNPAALVRAFSASGLGDAGWTLVLKTKHLMDRPGDGAALSALVEATPNAVLIDRGMPAGQLGELLALADIYASPHCSEGFGLTIAEAMAAGKPVVATDFGGSTDHLDATTGYPVKARRWKLDRDFGHYHEGGEWARIDEPALTATLRKAARDVIAGEVSIGRKAQSRIGERLSYAAVGEAIATSLHATMQGGGTGVAARRRIRTDRGISIDQADFGPFVRVALLGADGAPSTDTVMAAEQPGDWVMFAPSGAVVLPDLQHYLWHHAGLRPDVAIFYSDDVAADTVEAIDQVRLKPEFDRTLLVAQDYIGAPVFVRSAVLATLGGIDPEKGTAAVADLLFRASDAGLSIARIPLVMLVHGGKRVTPSGKDYARMLKAQPSLAGQDIISGRTANSFAQLGRFTAKTAPPLTIIIPTCRTPLTDAQGSYVERLLVEIAKADWPMERLRVIVGDDIAGEPDWTSAHWPFTLRRIETIRPAAAPFNYAAKMNQLWRAAETELLLFLNDDCQPTGTGWLKALMTFAVDGGVGGVGARLLYEDGRLQHAGLAPHGHGAAHVWLFRDRIEGSYQDWSLVQREWSMVTGAVFATRRSVMEQVDGFDERFSLEYNDTDLCLRLRSLGYRIVCTPLAEMIHSEKASRGERLPPGDDTALFLSRWKPWFDNDPAWHPQLRRDRLDMTPQPEDGAWYL